MTPTPTKSVFGIIGVIAAFLALFAVLVGPTIHDAIFPKPPAEERIADTVVKLHDRIKAHIKKAPDTAPPERLKLNSPALPYTISMACAAIAILGGGISYLRREDRRLAYVACGVGVLALAWQVMLLAVAAVVLCGILYAAASWFGDT